MGDADRNQAQSASAIDPTKFASTVSAISSAFGDPTRRDVFLMVHQAGRGVTAAEVAGAFDLHVNVARHHLDKLAGGGYVAVAIERNEGARAGRPSKHYRATEPDLGPLLTVRHDQVLVNLLNRALAMLAPDQAEALAHEVGVDYGRMMAASMGDINESQRSLRSALHTVADAMTAQGFEAHVDGSDDGDPLRIVAEHCPFGGAEVVHPVICAVDRGMVQGMMETLYGQTSSDQTTSANSDDEFCTTEVVGTA